MSALFSRLNGRQGKTQSSQRYLGQGISSSDLPRSPTGESRFQDAAQETLMDDEQDAHSPPLPDKQGLKTNGKSLGASLANGSGPLKPIQGRMPSADQYGNDLQRQRSAGSIPASENSFAAHTHSSASANNGARHSPQAIRQFLTASTSSRYYDEFGASRGQGPYFAQPDMVPGSSSSTLTTIPKRRGASTKSGADLSRNGSGDRPASTARSGGIGAAGTLPSPHLSSKLSPQPSRRMYKTLPARPGAPLDAATERGSNAQPVPAGSQPMHQVQERQQQRQQIEAPAQPPVYGYTPMGWDKQLDTPKVAELVLMCGEQIRARGLDSPLIFSSMALGLSGRKVGSLINSYLTSPREFFTSETRFADAHDLSAVIKWALARLGRVYPVLVPSAEGSRRHGNNDAAQEDSVFVHQRGFLEVDAYQTWAAQERSSDYPVAAFSTFLDGLQSSTAALLVALLSLLSSTTSYSLKNGMTPSRLGRLFGPLMFGLPEDESFDRTYDCYVRASNAAEHLLLAYIRDMSATETLPVRLADHIRGYPAMLSQDLTRFARGVRTIPVTVISRNVRLYSIDLVRQAAEMDLKDVSPEWAACCGTDEANAQSPMAALPQISDRYRKLINLRAGATLPSNGQHVSTEQELESYKSLADKAWGDFLTEGFAEPDGSKLAFDLYESQRKGTPRLNRDSVGWSTFQENGFAVDGEELDSALAFDWGISEDLRKWPEERAELMNKLQKTDKAMPSFHYDTKPRIVASPSRDGNAAGQWDEKPYSKIDDVFPEVYSDYLLCNGWSNRDELTHRHANFIVVQYKSRPTASSTVDGLRAQRRQSRILDDRTDASWFVVEEVVPLQYRAELEAVGRQKNKSRASMRALSIFRKRKDAHGQSNAQYAGIFEDFLKPNLGSVLPKRSGVHHDRRSLESDLERNDSQSSTVHGHEKSSSGHHASKAAPAAVTSSARLLTSLKERAAKKLARGKSTRTSAGAERAPEVPRKGANDPVRERTFSSSDYDAHSLQDAEIDAIANKSPPRKNKLFTMGRATKVSHDDDWLDVMLKTDSRMSGQDAERRDKSAGSVSRKQPPVNDSEMSPIKSESFNLTLDVGERDSLLSSALESEPQRDPMISSNGGLSGNDGSSSPPRRYMGLNHPWTQASSERLRLSSPPKDTIAKQSAGAQSPSAQDYMSAANLSPRQSSLPGHSPRLTSPSASPILASAAAASKPGQQPAEPVASPQRTSSLEHDVLKPKKPNSPSQRKQVSEEPSGAAEVSSSPSPSPQPAQPISKPASSRKDGRFSPEDREKAREERIKAAKERAKELRAGLTPVGQSEAAKKTAERRLPNLTTSPPKDDPFSKDRFSGRVASITSKFGGAAPKPITPQSTGEKSSPAGNRGGFSPASLASATQKFAAPASSKDGSSEMSDSNSKDDPFVTKLQPVSKPYEPKVASRSTAAANADRLRGHSPEAFTQKESSAQADKGAVSPFQGPSSPRQPSEDPNEMYGQPPSTDVFAGGGDGDSIYPEDAASNFAPDTQDEDSGSKNQSPVAHYTYPEGSLFSNLHQSPALAGAAASAAIGNMSPQGLGLSMDSKASTSADSPRATFSSLGHPGDDGRYEDEDQATDMANFENYMPRYQPGMPLSNVEEERESILSGSNV